MPGTEGRPKRPATPLTNNKAASPIKRTRPCIYIFHSPRTSSRRASFISLASQHSSNIRPSFTTPFPLVLLAVTLPARSPSRLTTPHAPAMPLLSCSKMLATVTDSRPGKYKRMSFESPERLTREGQLPVKEGCRGRRIDI